MLLIKQFLPILEHFFNKSKSEWYDVKNELIGLWCLLSAAPDDADDDDDDEDVNNGYDGGGGICDCITFLSTVLLSFVVAVDVTVNVNEDLLLEQIDDILSWIEWLCWWLWRWWLWWERCFERWLWQWQHDILNASRNVSFEMNMINGKNNASNNESATNIRSRNGVHIPGIKMANKLNTWSMTKEKSFKLISSKKQRKNFFLKI